VRRGTDGAEPSNTEPSKAEPLGGSALKPPSNRRGRWIAASVVVGVVVVGAVGATAIVHHQVGASGTDGSSDPAANTKLIARLADAVKTDPLNGSTGIALDAPISVTTSIGHLVSVQVAPIGGQELTGTLDAHSTQWTESGALAASTLYQVRTVVKSRSGLTTTAISSFTTLTPASWVSASLWPDDGLTVGVGQPIVLKFTQPITSLAARQTLLSHLSLSLSDPVPVGAYWFSETEMHLRPENYWPVGEQIFMAENLNGWDATGGLWGQGIVTVRFAIGNSHISTANLSTDEMTVTNNGQVVATYPISGGRPEYPTMDGVHIVLDTEPQVQMISSTVGIPVNSPDGYDETVYWDVHISDSGEYVHAAPWSVSDQGVTNVSHGCINISTANAQQFYGFSQIGDIVDVVGGPRPPAPGDHGVMDWTTPWSDFTPITVLPLNPPASTTTTTTPPSATTTSPSSSSYTQ